MADRPGLPWTLRCTRCSFHINRERTRQGFADRAACDGREMARLGRIARESSDVQGLL